MIDTEWATHSYGVQFDQALHEYTLAKPYNHTENYSQPSKVSFPSLLRHSPSQAPSTMYSASVRLGEIASFKFYINGVFLSGGFHLA